MILHNSTFQSFLFSSHVVKFNLCATLPARQRGREERKEEDGGEDDSDRRGYVTVLMVMAAMTTVVRRIVMVMCGRDGDTVLMVGTVMVMFSVIMVVTAVTAMTGQ